MLLESAQAAQEKHAEDIQILDMRGLTDVAEFFFICSAHSTRQAKAIADHLMHQLNEVPLPPDHLEGYPSNGWILLDCGKVVYHIFIDELRSHYDLDGLWSDAKRLSLPHGNRLIPNSERRSEVAAPHHRQA